MLPCKQLVGNPSEECQSEQATDKDSPVKRPGIPPVHYVLFGAVLGFYCFFVNALEGLDGDTFFLALFCTVLTVFVCQALSAALNREAD